VLEGEEGLNAVIGSTAWGLGERKKGLAWARGIRPRPPEAPRRGVFIGARNARGGLCRAADSEWSSVSCCQPVSHFSRDPGPTPRMACAVAGSRAAPRDDAPRRGGPPTTRTRYSYPAGDGPPQLLRRMSPGHGQPRRARPTAYPSRDVRPCAHGSRSRALRRRSSSEAHPEPRRSDRGAG
jgi:hypothetical protein